MLTGRDVQKLRHVMRDEFSAAPRIVLKCAVMLLMIFGLAWIGVSGELSTVHSSPYPAVQTAIKSDSHARTVFEERRTRYIEAYPDSHVAREAANLRQKDANADGGYFYYQPD
jgi:hypothetical protein